MSNPDPTVQAKWAGFEYAGDESMQEEFILLGTDKGEWGLRHTEGFFCLAFLLLFSYNVY